MRPLFFAVFLAACTDPLAGPAFDPSQDREGSVDPGELLITEVMADPADCSDSTGEWIELKNASREALDLNGLVLADADGNRATIEAPGSIPAGTSIIVGLADPDRYCGPGATAYATGVSLNNSGEALVLLDGEVLIDATPWFDGSRIDAGQSLQLHPSYIFGNAPEVGWYTAEQCINTVGSSPGSMNMDCVTPDMTTFTALAVPTPTSPAQQHAVMAVNRAWLDGVEHSVG